MPMTNYEKVLVRSGSSLDPLAAIPIKKRHFLYAPPSPPREAPFPVLSDCGIPEEKKPAPVNVPKDLSPELADCTPGRKPELLMPASPISKMDTEHSLTGTCDLPPLPAESVIPKVGCKPTIHGELTAVEGITVKQEGREEQTIQSNPKDNEMNDANYVCPERSTWDLNTTMDAWEGSSSDSSLTRADFGGQDFGGKNNGGGQNSKGPLLDLKQSLFTGSIGAKQLGNNGESDKPDDNLKLANSCKSSINSTCEASLDLSLKPSFLLNTCITSGKHEATKGTPFLSLSTKPMLPTSVPPFATKTPKSEPVEKEIPVHAGKLYLDMPISLNMKHVKSEPCEQQDMPNAVGEKNLTCTRAVKPEPLEHQASENTKSPEGTSYPMRPTDHTLAPQITQMFPKAGTMMLNTVASNDTSSMETPIPGNVMSTGTPVTQDSSVVKTEPSNLVSSPILNGNDMNLLQEALLPKSLTLHVNEDDKHIPAEAASKFAVKIDSLNAHCLPRETSLDEIIRNCCQSCGNSKAVKANEVEGNIEISSEILEGPCTTCKSDKSPAGAMDTVSKQEGRNNVDCENGGARNPASDVTNEGPSFSMPSFVDKSEIEVQSLEQSNACGSEDHDGGLDTKVESGSSPVEVPSSKQEGKINEDCENGGARTPATDITDEGPSVSMPSFVGKKETEVGSSVEGNACGSKEHDGDLDTKVEPGSSPVETTNNVPGIQSFSKISKKILKDHQKTNKGSKKKIEASDLRTRTSLLDSQSGVTSNFQQNTDRPKVAENFVSAKAANDRGNSRRIVYLNSTTNSLASGKKNFTPERSISYREERERPFKRSFRGERSSPGGRREESRTDSSRKIDIEGHYGNRSRTDRPSPLHGERNLTEVRDFRPLRRDGEFAIGADGFRRPRRRLTNEELDNLSPCPTRHRPINHISPRKLDERDVPDFRLASRGEKLLNMQAAGIYTSGGRSLSPSLRRGGSPRLLNEGLQSSSRSQLHSIHHSDGFTEPREFVRRESMRHRSPPIRRVNNRMQLPQDMIVRRRRSPLYMGQVPNDMVDVGAFKEDYPRPARGFTRNMRQRINDHRESNEEHYLGQEFHVSHDFVEDGRYVDRPGPIPSFRQQLIAGDRQSNHSHDEDGRALRLRPVLEGSDPRNFDVCYRNWLGDSSGRLRGAVEDQVNYKQHEQQEWHDAAMSDARHKRRRF